MRTSRMHVAVVAAVAIAGCALDKSPPPADDLLDMGRYLSRYAATTGSDISQLDFAEVPGGPVRGKYTDFDGYRAGKTWWCRSDERGDPLLWTKKAYGELCRRRGGIYEEGFCSAPSDHDTVLFMARVTGFEDNCSQIEVSVLEATSASASSAYRAQLLRYGFKTSAMQQAELAHKQRQTDAAMARRAQEAADQLARVEREWTLMKKRGTAVCRQSGGITYFGYVDDSTTDRLKILVVRAALTRAPAIAPGDFRQETVWTNPAEWYLCTGL
ncbi:hypothetical protein [Roseateles violae]|uniref:DUF1311 domain-containing protein n=1 Tax=Roseateles violae TaxID=3058042 RepID=A0ABT8DV49_9BURK|nr:hypothetical protein [Pelomonas sp. PFR6]MDN3920041.1 hypothetical protein [Pelomonas sp. PFR6]